MAAVRPVGAQERVVGAWQAGRAQAALGGLLAGEEHNATLPCIANHQMLCYDACNTCHAMTAIRLCEHHSDTIQLARHCRQSVVLSCII